MHAADTIFALSSGAPPAAIAIIRISGPLAFQAVETLAGRIPPPRRASLMLLRHPVSGNELDNALALVFPGPDTATGEDLTELHLHGGRAVVRAVESALAQISGLRQAEAGEFTRRAFQNGRIDLNEAEGLADLLSAETEWQRRAASQMASGAFSSQIETWRNELLQLSASIEAELDFSDEDDVDVQQNNNISNGCIRLHDAIIGLLAMPTAEKLRDGLRVVLGGPPNSGKSTLLNTLVEREAAIVSEIAGTTRDTIEVPLAIDGIPLLFIDTAGVRDGTNDAIEAMGIDRSHKAMAAADIILWLGEEGSGPDHKQLLEIETKADDIKSAQKSKAALRVSAHTGQGLENLVAEITSRAKTLLPPRDQFAINTRQRVLMADCTRSLQDAAQASDGLIVAEHLRQARLSLDELTGRAHTEDMLDTLFTRFCIGK